MTRDGVIAFAQIIPVLYIAVHFTIRGMPVLRSVTAIYAAIAEALLLFNIAVGEDPEPILTWLSFTTMILMLTTLAAGAIRSIHGYDKPDSEHDTDGDK